MYWEAESTVYVWEVIVRVGSRKVGKKCSVLLPTIRSNVFGGRAVDEVKGGRKVFVRLPMTMADTEGSRATVVPDTAILPFGVRVCDAIMY